MKRPTELLIGNLGGFLALLIALIPKTGAIADWPLVRGDVLGSGAAAAELPDHIEQLWVYQPGGDAGFDATAVVAEGVIYLGDTEGTFHAVRLADSTPVWVKKFADTSFAAGAAIAHGRIFVGDLSGVVRCLSTTDGEELWSRSLESEIYAGPTATGEKVLVTCESGALACFDAATGEPCWPPFTIDAPLRCSPTLSAGRVMLAGCDSQLHVINAADGKQLGTIEIDGPTGATAATQEQRVYFGTEGGTFFAIEVPPAVDTKYAVAWTFRDPRRSQPIRTAAAVAGDLVVFGSQGKAIYGLNTQTGEVKWQLATRARVESSPVICGTRVVAATADGKLYLLDAANGDVKWQYDAGGSFTASPAVSEGRIVLGNTDGRLYCFGESQHEKTKKANFTDQ